MNNRFLHLGTGRLSVPDWNFWAISRLDMNAIGANLRRIARSFLELVRAEATGWPSSQEDSAVDWPTLEYRIAESIETFLEYSGSRELFTGNWHVVIGREHDVTLTREPGFHSDQIFVAKIGKPNNLNAIKRLMDLEDLHRRRIINAISTEIVSRAKLLHAA